MDADVLKSMGEIAGLGGLALGVFLWVVLTTVSRADKASRATLAFFKYAATLAFAAALVGMGLWGWGEFRPSGSVAVESGVGAGGNAMIKGDVEVTGGARPPAPNSGGGVAVGAGVGAGGDVTIEGDVTINQQVSKLTPEEIRAIAKAVTREERGYEDKIKALGDELTLRADAVAGFFRILGRDPDLAPERLPDALAEIARRHKAFVAELNALKSDDPAVRSLKEQAAKAADDGDYAQAEDLLRRAEKADLDAANAMKDAADARLIGAAATRAQLGDLRLLERDYPAAARAFADAADLLPSTAPDAVRGAYLRRRADALQTLGDEKGDNDALRAAIDGYGAALALFPRDTAPGDWAMTWNNLGTALRTLGARESGTERLEQAVDAYREALKERTRERVPLQWAATWNNLGNALQTLGARESGTGRLEQAEDAYREALKERTRERVPLDWAMTWNNLGNALRALGERESGTAGLRRAEEAYRAALEVYAAAGAGYYIEVVERNLAIVRAMIEARSGGESDGG